MFFKSRRTQTEPEEPREPTTSFKGRVVRCSILGESATVNLVVAVQDGEKVRNIEVKGSPFSHPFLGAAAIGDEVEGTYFVQQFLTQYSQTYNYLRTFKNLTLDS